jgi:hypothetical protein
MITIVTYQHPGENGQGTFLLAISLLPEDAKAYGNIP